MMSFRAAFRYLQMVPARDEPAHGQGGLDVHARVLAPEMGPLPRHLLATATGRGDCFDRKGDRLDRKGDRWGLSTATVTGSANAVIWLLPCQSLITGSVIGTSGSVVAVVVAQMGFRKPCTSCPVVSF